jgi:Uma2 family endonuclease
MSQTLTLPHAARELTAADLTGRFGPIPLRRIRWGPCPGTATEADVLTIQQREKVLCELVDGILVEKTTGIPEAFLASVLIRILGTWVADRRLGCVLGPAGMLRLAPGLVRIPDVSYVPWGRFPNRQLPDSPMLELAPDLAVEILSPGNTRQEIEAKLRDYFASNVLLVWCVDPRQRTVEVYTAPAQSIVLIQDQTLDGRPVLPGFTLPLRQLFAELDPH